MKTSNESSKTIRNFDLLVSEIAEVEILNIEAMSFVKGGSGEGGEPIIIRPKF
jgi:hypothetical protein